MEQPAHGPTEHQQALESNGETAEVVDPFIVEILGLFESLLEPDDIEWLVQGVDDQGRPLESTEIFTYLYGRLIELGHDPDEVLTEAGIFIPDATD